MTNPERISDELRPCPAIKMSRSAMNDEYRRPVSLWDAVKAMLWIGA